MDAEKLEFPDNSFDVVMAQYVVTAVPNPEAALDEFARVLRPGGELIILTRVSADAGMRRFIEQKLQPVVRPLGFRTAEFAWSRYAKWLARCARHGTRRAPPDSAARPFLAGALPQDRRRQGRVSAGEVALCVIASLRSVTCHYDDVTRRTSNPCKLMSESYWGKA